MNWRPFTASLLLVASSARADDTPGRDFNWEGRVSAGGAVRDFKHGASFHDVQLELESKRRKGTRAKVTLTGESDEPGLLLEEAFIDHKLESGEKLLFGQAKKRLGREYEDSHRERLTVKRSPLYRKLEEFAFVGHELTLQWLREDAWSLSAGYSESIDADLILHAQSDGYGVWLLAQSDRIDNGRQLVYTLLSSVWHHEGPDRAEAELAFGKDPFASEFERAFGDGTDVHFAALKGQYGHRVEIAGGETLEPVVQATYLVHDHRTPSWTTVQLLVGVNYVIDESLRISLDVEGLGSNSTLDLERRSYDESNVQLEATYYF